MEDPPAMDTPLNEAHPGPHSVQSRSSKKRTYVSALTLCLQLSTGTTVRSRPKHPREGNSCKSLGYGYQIPNTFHHSPPTTK